MRCFGLIHTISARSDKDRQHIKEHIKKLSENSFHLHYKDTNKKQNIRLLCDWQTPDEQLLSEGNMFWLNIISREERKFG